MTGISHAAQPGAPRGLADIIYNKWHACPGSYKNSNNMDYSSIGRRRMIREEGEGGGVGT